MTDDPTRAIPAAAMIAGRYRLDALVGRGGTAEVWKATDTSLERTVALKLVTVAHDESSARAADEAKTLARLSHPSLVQVYDAGTDTSGRPWVVMEFIEGETMADAVRRGPLPVHRIAEIGASVAEALDHVHAQGLVHRDVKPANVMLGRGGAVKLTDFGIARLVDAAKVTSTGLMVGTASYLAPEQVAGEPVGPPADVYSLGLLLLEALTGKREYDGPAVEAAMARLSRDPAMPPSLPLGWAPLLQAMTRREAGARPTSLEASQVLRGLSLGEATTVLAAPVPVPASVISAPSSPEATTVLRTTRPAATVTPPARNRTPIVVASAVAVAVLAGVGVALATGGSPAPKQIPQISRDLPKEISDPLRTLVTRVQP